MAKAKRPKSKTMMDDIIGRLESGKMDEQAEYLGRGRSYASLSVEELKDQWCVAFNARAADFRSLPMHRWVADLASELGLRGIEPPYERVDLNKVASAIGAHLQEMQRNDPEGFQKHSDELDADLEAFRTARDKPKN